MVQGLDEPVPADPFGELAGARLGDGQAGDRANGDGAPFPAGQRADAAGDADRLGCMGEGEPGGDGDGFERAALLAAVAPVALPGQDRDLPPGQVLKLGVQARLVLLDDEDVVGLLLLDQELGVRGGIFTTSMPAPARTSSKTW